jgi:hypothetical protein
MEAALRLISLGAVGERFPALGRISITNRPPGFARGFSSNFHRQTLTDAKTAKRSQNQRLSTLLIPLGVGMFRLLALGQVPITNRLLRFAVGALFRNLGRPFPVGESIAAPGSAKAHWTPAAQEMADR